MRRKDEPIERAHKELKRRAMAMEHMGPGRLRALLAFEELTKGLPDYR